MKIMAIILTLAVTAAFSVNVSAAQKKANPSQNRKIVMAAAQGQEPALLTTAQDALLLFDDINAERENKSLAPYAYDTKLSEIAELKALSLAGGGQLEHLSPVYGTPYQMLKNMGAVCRMASENIVAGSSESEISAGSVGQISDNINVTNAHFTEMGVGLAISPKYGLVAVELFAD